MAIEKFGRWLGAVRLVQDYSKARAPDLLRLDEVTKDFGRRAGWLHGTDTRVKAVDAVSLTLHRGESFGLVGESGSGKTSLGRMVLRFDRPSSGSVIFDKSNVNELRGADLKRYRQRVQMIFQNPFSSLNPRRTVRDTLAAGYAIHEIATGKEREGRMAELLERVGLRADMLDRYPHQFSGGQRQRIVIARALSVGPELIVADEPVSALDVSIQAQVLNLMKSLQEDYELTYLMITHDLRVVGFFCTRIGVMYLGRLVEIGARRDLLSQPLHPYTRVLISAAPSGNVHLRARAIVRGEIASSFQERQGCVFSNRCWLKKALGNPARCEAERPPLRELGSGRLVACHYAESSSSPLRTPLTEPAVVAAEK
jgi:oligopeptide/dipeptide ABC transporter ATP-binding protein